MRIEPEQVEAVFRMLQRWGADLPEEWLQDLIAEFDVDLGDPSEPTAGKARRNDPWPSKEAALFDEKGKGEKNFKVFCAIAKSHDGLTADEAVRATGIPYRTLTARLGQLQDRGWIVRTDRARPGDSGRNQSIRILTQYGLDYAERKGLV